MLCFHVNHDIQDAEPHSRYCIVYKILPNDAVSFGVSYCGEREYNKKTGREIAEERLEKNPICLKSVFSSVIKRSLEGKIAPGTLREILERNKEEEYGVESLTPSELKAFICDYVETHRPYLRRFATDNETL